MRPTILGVGPNSFNPSRLITSSLPLGSENSVSQSVSAFSNGLGKDHDVIWARRCEEVCWELTSTFSPSGQCDLSR